LKGKNRPLNTLEDRISVLEALSVVDAIVAFEEQTPLRLIKQIKPDVLVKGADYSEEEIVGAEVVKEGGGKVVRIPLLEGKSTTGLIKQIEGSQQ
jgi:D-beta-D-heptose 7-phosphate kinase/D-beta-D-heptose 1-phosphate adenosyltransferase